MKMESIRLAGLLFCLTPVAAAVAQTAGPAEAVAVASVQEGGANADTYRVVVTGARSEMRLKDTPQRIEVVTRKEIEQTPHHDLADLLNKNTNVDIKRYPGMNAAVSVRGYTPSSPMVGESWQTLFLQDGIPAIKDNIGLIPSHGAARVEVLRGPSSALYGAQAMSGVINVIPVRRTGDLQGGVGVSVGNFKHRSVQADIGGALTPWLNLDYFGSWQKQGDYKSGDGTRWNNSAATQYSHGLRLGFELAPGWTLDARADLARGDDVGNPGAWSEYDGKPTVKDVKRDLYSAKLKGVMGQHAVSAAVYSGKETNITYKAPPSGERPLDFDAKITWQGVQLKDEWTWADGYKLVYGLDYDQTKAGSVSYLLGPATVYNPDSKLQTTAIYAQQHMAFNNDQTNVYVGGRYDRFKLSTLPTALLPNNTPQSRTFNQFSPSAGIKHYFTPMVAVHASAGKGFMAPSAWKLAGDYSTFSNYRGNPNLKPESSRSADIGVTLEQPDWNVDLTFYDTRVKDKIVSYKYQEAGKGYTSWINADQARMRGLELTAGWDINPNLKLGLGYTHSLRAESESKGVWKDLEYVPKHSARLTLDGNWDKLHTRVGARYTGKATKSAFFADWSSTTKQYPGYTLWDASVAYRFLPNHTLSFSVDNLFDKYYESVPGYAMPGREFKLGYRWDFK